MKTAISGNTVAQNHKLIGMCIVPRPVALVTSIGADGVYGAAPYGTVAPVAWKPPLLMVSIGLRKGEKKRTTINIQSSGDFVINIMNEAFFKQTIQTAAHHPPHVDKIARAGLTALPGDMVKSPRIAEARISLECRLSQVLAMGGPEDPRDVVFGEVVLIHARDDICRGGEIDPTLVGAVGRLTSSSTPAIYARTGDVFRLGYADR